VEAARYDGYADWYDGWRRDAAQANGRVIAELLGPGEGPCLDLGCGTGLLFGALAGTGRTVVGLDYSADQLRVARRRSDTVVRGDGAVLPFADAAFTTVVTCFISTDVDNFPAVVAEAARVLRPGGVFLFLGAHPCFNGPHIEWLEDGGVRAHPTYRQPGWHPEAPWWGVQVRRRVGMRQHTLADMLNSFVTAGLTMEHFAEPGTKAVPHTLTIRARKQRPASY
jgi:ubiquinone/menaquinone biosynthesis C-methylase UbiE